jgi:type IV secretion system protein VirB6
MASDLMFFQFIGETVENAIAAFVTPAAGSLIGIITPIVVTGVTLYITMTGYAIMTGAIEAPLPFA